MLELIQTKVTIRMLGVGRGREWLGPAVRGAIGLAWKNGVCRYPPSEREIRWRYCKGCPHLASCSYGRNFEPEFPAGFPGWQGRERATPRVVNAPPFPGPEAFTCVDELPLSITLVGPDARADLPALIMAIQKAGERGLGDPGTPFKVAETGAVRQCILDPDDLPRGPVVSAGRIDGLEIKLITPMVLREVTRPTLADLFGASMRAVEQLLALHGQPVDEDYDGMIKSAGAAKLVAHEFQPFSQERKSNRTGQYRTPPAVKGWGLYDHVPAFTLPWLAWGAALHIGQERGTGAGAIRITCNALGDLNRP